MDHRCISVAKDEIGGAVGAFDGEELIEVVDGILRASGSLNITGKSKRGRSM